MLTKDIKYCILKKNDKDSEMYFIAYILLFYKVYYSYINTIIW
jgi:hypothetical protein